MLVEEVLNHGVKSQDLQLLVYLLPKKLSLRHSSHLHRKLPGQIEERKKKAYAFTVKINGMLGINLST